MVMDLAVSPPVTTRGSEHSVKFKESEAGDIPTDWDAVYVENVATITTGSRNTQDRVQGGAFPFFVRSQNVERINSYSFDKEAVLTAGDGVGTGKIFHYFSGKFDVHQRVYVMSDFTESISGYFFYLVFSSKFYNRIMQMTAKSSVDSVRREMIAGMAIPLPPRREQDEIVGALREADGLIVALEQLVAKKRLIKNGMMQELLSGRKRLPDFETNSGFQRSSIGNIPKDWALPTLGELCSFENGDRGKNYPSKNDFSLYGIPFVNAGHIKDGAISIEGMNFITKDKFSCLGSGKFVPGDILFCLRGSIGKYATVDRQFGKGAIASSLIIMRPNERHLDQSYLRSYLGSEHCERMINRWAGGAAQPNLGAGDLAQFCIPLPPTKEEQSAIAEVLDNMEDEILEVERKLEKVRKVKQGMMQELLTGRIRLV